MLLSNALLPIVACYKVSTYCGDERCAFGAALKDRWRGVEKLQKYEHFFKVNTAFRCDERTLQPKSIL